ncbi:DUF4916 domain-containing protein (plasmid) [Coraliomargarita sp. W4R53]
MFLPADLYAQIESSMPIACVDFVPVRDCKAGLILRHSPFGSVWCHLGGRIERGETIRDALRRHASDTLGVGLDLPLDPQPAYVYQWFPAAIRPNDGTVHGVDPRKHAIGLSFVVELEGEPAPQNEALDFEWFDRDALPEMMWPGSANLVRRLIVADPPVGRC